MRQVSISEARVQFSALIAAVEGGEEIVIARRGKPVARVLRCDEAPRRKKPILGGLKGMAREIDPNWWKPTPDDEIREMFGDRYADEVGAP